MQEQAPAPRGPAGPRVPKRPRAWNRTGLAVAPASIVGAKRERNQTLKREQLAERVVQAAVEIVRSGHAALATRTPSASSLREASSGSGRANR